VLDLFKRQIKHQDYITVTHPDMTRFICTIDEAVEFLIRSGEIAAGGEILIKKMPGIRIMDLAEVIIKYMAPIYSKDAEKFKIDIIRKHASEKLYEELITFHEAERTLEFDDYYCILPTISEDYPAIYDTKNSRPAVGEISSNNCTYLTREEILSFLKKNKLL
jgi:UDP-N-acetylglucosamine 4,6-dehydratase/5-epimerase